MGRLTRLIVGVVLVCVLMPDTALAAFPGKNGRIAFDGYPGSGSTEIYTMNADGSDVQRLMIDAVNDVLPAWSPDGKKIAFGRGTYPNIDVYVMNADGSAVTQLTNDPAYDSQPAWSPDGTKIAFASNRDGDFDVYTMNADGTRPVNLSDDNPLPDVDPAWSPDGSTIAFSRDIDDEGYSREVYFLYTMNPDGTGKAAVQYGYNGPPNCLGILKSDAPDWSPDGATIAYHGVNDYDGDYCISIESVKPDGSGRDVLATVITGALEDVFNGPAWSPDGTRIAYGAQNRIRIVNPNGSGAVDVGPAGISASDPDWQSIPVNGYPRPKGATPIHLPLVPAYVQCTAPNRTHGPPLGFSSCGPPSRSSTYLTVGTPDSNGKPAQSGGYARIDVQVGNPATPADEANVMLHVHVTDVRLASDLSDYTGELQAAPRIRITDKLNTPHPGGPGAGTVTDLVFPFPVPCAATPDASVGATCTTTTSADALVPDAVQEKRRAIWALEKFEVGDGGPLASPVNRPFLVQGLFVP